MVMSEPHLRSAGVHIPFVVPGKAEHCAAVESGANLCKHTRTQGNKRGSACVWDKLMGPCGSRRRRAYFSCDQAVSNIQEKKDAAYSTCSNGKVGEASVHPRHTLFEEERDVLEGSLWELNKGSMESFGTLDDGEKTVAILRLTRMFYHGWWNSCGCSQ